MSKPFTNPFLESLKPKPSVYRQRDGISDPELKGFAISVRPSGSKSFEFGYTSPTTGKRCFLTLAHYPAASIAEARQLCREARALVRAGVDPKEQRDREEAERLQAARAQANRGTVAELFDFHIQDLQKRNKTKGAITQAKSLFKNHIASKLGRMVARDVTPRDVLNVLRAVEGAYMRREVYTRLKAAFKFGMIGENTDR